MSRPYRVAGLLALSPLIATLLRTGEFMAKYMYQASYTLEGVRGLLKETASGRRKAVESAIAALGRKGRVVLLLFRERRCRAYHGPSR